MPSQSRDLPSDLRYTERVEQIHAALDSPVYDAEIIDLDALCPEPLQYPPAIREPVALIAAPCFCGNITPRGHGRIDGRRRFTCEEILAMRRDVEHYSVPAWLRAWRRLTRHGGAR